MSEEEIIKEEKGLWIRTSREFWFAKKFHLHDNHDSGHCHIATSRNCWPRSIAVPSVAVGDKILSMIQAAVARGDEVFDARAALEKLEAETEEGSDDA